MIPAFTLKYQVKTISQSLQKCGKAFVFLLLFSSINNAYGQDTSRSGYTLFKPLPRSLMRKEMETDRPNVTETPHTVEAGHFQYEADLFKFQRERSEETRQHSWLANQVNLKLGLLKNTALQVMVQSYGKEINHEITSGEKQSASGFGDITLRVKQSLYGNYDGNFSIALMPYVKFPTNTYSDNKMYEEGLMVPMLFKLPHDWKIGMQVEGDYLKDDDAPARHAELLQSVSLSHVLFKKLEVFGESFYTYNFKEHKINNFLDAALEYEITHDLKIDVGINYGLQTMAHKDYFAGIAFRY
jgi:hypothetical protein